jgi:hypothetical protein
MDIEKSKMKKIPISKLGLNKGCLIEGSITLFSQRAP